MKIRSTWPLIAASLISLIACQRTPLLDGGNIDQVVKAMTTREKASMVLSVCDSSDSVSLIRTRAIDRLGIPSIAIAEINGAGPVNTLDFPSPLLLASTWDDGLIDASAAMMAHDAVDSGIDVIMEPSLNLMRNPLAGNSSDRFSEAPLVTGRCAAAMVRGINGAGAAAAIKYFAAANQTTNGDKFDACISPRALRELYLKGFELALEGSSPSAVVAARNKLNGTEASANDDLLRDLLRGEWKFSGAVFGQSGQGSDAAAKIAAGSDLLLPGEDAQIDSLEAFVADGRLSGEALDSSVKNILRLIVSTPAIKQQGASLHAEPDFDATLRSAAAAGIVLLENRYQALPITDSLTEAISIYEAAQDSSAAIASQLAQALSAAGCTISAGRDSSDVAIVVISRRQEPLDRQIADFDLSGEERSLLESVCEEYHAEDKYVIAVLNIDSVIETASWKDKPDALLLAFSPGAGAAGALADIITGAVTPSGKLTVTFPINYMDIPASRNFPVRPSPSPEDAARRRGPGPGGPSADVAPDGKGPREPAGMRPPMPGGPRRDSTHRPPRRSRSDFMPRHDSSVVASRGQRNVDYTLYQEGVFVGYRFFTSFDREVSYPFGYGLSYTTFDYEEPDVILRRNSLRVFVKVTNTGSWPGSEVVQLYAVSPEGSLDKTSITLADYTKTPVLAPGESYVASFTVPFKALASFNSSSSSWTVDAGSYIIKAGASCTDIRSETALVLDDSVSWKTSDILQQQYPINEMHRRHSIFRERTRRRHMGEADTLPQSAINPADSLAK